MRFFLVLLLLSITIVHGDEKIDLKFKGPDIYKVQWGVDRPTFVDLNDDNKIDFIIADVAKGKLELHISTTIEEQNKEKIKNKDVNHITYDNKYRVEYFLTENQIIGVWAGKLYPKIKTSIIYTTGTNELFILGKNENGVWQKDLTFEIKPVANQGFQSIFIADFNSDKLNDIMVVGSLGFEFFYQDKSGSFKSRSLHTIDDPFKNKILNVFVIDINNDKKLDVAYLTVGEIFLKYRLQLEDGSLSAEHAMEGDKIVDGTITHLDVKDDKSLYLAGIQAKSQAVSVSKINFESSENKNKKIFGTPELLLLPESKKPYMILFDDINGDGTKDIIATTPTSAEVLVYILDKEGLHKNIRKYSSFMNINNMQLFDWDQDGKNELYVLSKDENTLGRTTWKNEGLSFPETIKTVDTPASFIFAPLVKGLLSSLIMIETVEKKEEVKEGEKSSDKPKKFSALRIYEKPNEKFVKEYIFEKTLSDVQFKAIDINHDSKTDFLIFEKYSKAQILLQKENGTFELLNQNNSKLGLLIDSEIKPWQIGTVIRNKSEIPSLSTKNFTRLIQYKDGSIETIEQFNSEESGASIVAMLQDDLDKDKMPETILYDGKNNIVDIYSNSSTGLTRKEKIKIGSFKFTGMDILDINSDKKSDIILFGEDKVLFLKNNHPISDLTPLSLYMPDEITPKQFTYLEIGELLPGRFQEIAIADAANNSVELFCLNKSGKLMHLLTFQIFEQRKFQQGDDGVQPQHIILKDINGDGLNDLFIIAHDKILIYTQLGASNEKSK